MKNTDPEAHEDNYDLIDHSSMSEFLYSMPHQLSWSKGWSPAHLDVFWSSGRAQTSSPSLAEAPGNEEMFKSTLQLYRDYSWYSILVQFWAPIVVENQIFLSTSELPFGLKDRRRGLCLYRKHCVDYRYIADGDNKNESRFGPPGRVFFHGVPEYNPNVECYSIKEYPLRDCAMRYGATTYLALPVFRSAAQHCVGVLEVLISFVPSWCPQDNFNHADIFKRFSSALKAVGLRSSDISFQSQLDVIEKRRYVTDGMKERLEMVCKVYNLPFAQVWKPKGDDGEIVFSSMKVSYMQNDKYSSFLSACEKRYLRKGEGVVGRAFSSFTSCFCKDITQISINDYSLALTASVVNLTSCFAICLRNSRTGFLVYILEFFLPTEAITFGEPWAFLDSLLGMMKHCFQSFTLASGLELGKELYVEVIRLSEDDKLYSSRICQTAMIPARRGSSLQNEEQNIHQFSCTEQLALGSDATTNGGNIICPEQSITALPHGQEFPSKREELPLNLPCRTLSLDIPAFQDREENVTGPKQTDILQTPFQKGSAAKTLDWGNEIAREVLEHDVGKKLDDVVEILGVRGSTVKRKCRKNKISRSPSCKRERVQHSLSIKDNEKHIAEDCFGDQRDSISTPEEGTVLNCKPILRATTMENESSMTIKARYGTDMIKFDLSLSSRMMELVDEVGKRLKLQTDTYKTKYYGNEKDLILLACDEDLHKCTSTMRSLGRQTVHIVIEPITQ